MICRNHVDVSEGVRRCTRCGGTYCPDCLVEIQGQPFCATCKTQQLMDVRSGVVHTPGYMPYSGFWQRCGAYIIDYVIQLVPIYAILLPAMFLSGFNGSNEPSPLFLLAYIPVMFIPIAYEAIMLTMKNGQTVGKMALRVRVVRPDGSRVSAGQAWGRAVMRLILGCLVVVDYIPYFFTDEKTTLHDLIAGTRVVDVY